MKLNPVVFAVALLLSGHIFASVTGEENFSFKLADGGRLSVANVNGSITVTGGNGDGVEITARKKADNQKDLDDIEIRISHSDESIKIETELPDSDSWFSHNNHSGQVSYTITVPAATNLDSVETVNGGVVIGGVAGNVVAKTVNGDLELDGLAGDARLSTVNGSISAAFVALRAQQKVKAETVNGRVTLHLPENADAKVSVDTLNGSINARDFDLQAEKGFIGNDLNGNIGNGSARLNIDTVNGTVKIKSH